MTPDPRIDAYIARAAPFAQPILLHIRQLAWAAAPHLDEAIKWGMPAFTWNGKMVFGMGAFKSHVTLGFWHGELVTGGTGKERSAMGSFGRITALADLPNKAELSAMIAEAADLAMRGVKAPHSAKPPIARLDVEIPDALLAALDGHPKAAETWAAFAPSHRREYAQWIAEAKRPETTARRVDQAISWLSEGKKRHWKYERC